MTKLGGPPTADHSIDLQVADATAPRRLGVGDLDAEVVFDVHDDFDRVEAHDIGPDLHDFTNHDDQLPSHASV